MAEQTESGQPQGISRRSLIKGAASLLLAAGLGQQAGSSSAEGTPTPEANATRIAGLKTVIAEQEKKNADNTAIAELEKKATTVMQPSTPASTPVPSSAINPTATAEARATINEASARYRGQLQATATAQAEQTETAVAKRTPVVAATESHAEIGGITPTATPPTGSEGKGVSITEGILGLSTAVGVVSLFSDRLRNGLRNVITLPYSVLRVFIGGVRRAGEATTAGEGEGTAGGTTTAAAAGTVIEGKVVSSEDVTPPTAGS